MKRTNAERRQTDYYNKYRKTEKGRMASRTSWMVRSFRNTPHPPTILSVSEYRWAQVEVCEARLPYNFIVSSGSPHALNAQAH